MFVCVFLFAPLCFFLSCSFVERFLLLLIFVLCVVCVSEIPFCFCLLFVLLRVLRSLWFFLFAFVFVVWGALMCFVLLFGVVCFSFVLCVLFCLRSFCSFVRFVCCCLVCVDCLFFFVCSSFVCSFLDGSFVFVV